MAPKSSDPEPYPLYNTTFTLHRVSPLYISSNLPLNNSTLEQHARQFRELLIGDVMRGVRVGLASEGDPISAAGTLEAITWRLLPGEEMWNLAKVTRLEGNDDTMIGLAATRGMRVTVAYEKISYSAILLRARREDRDESVVEDCDGFQNFPLLLTKMPASLRDAFTGYLSENFDARVSNLRLSSKYITNVFEKYISDLAIGEDGEEMDFAERSRPLRGIIRETEIFVAFDLPKRSGALKTMEIHLTSEDLPGLVARGKKIVNQRKEGSPFMEALTIYVKDHLALELRHEGVKVVKIACGAFVLGGEGRVKLIEPLRANEGEDPQVRAEKALVDGLLRTAAGGGLLRAVS